LVAATAAADTFLTSAIMRSFLPEVIDKTSLSVVGW